MFYGNITQFWSDQYKYTLYHIPEISGFNASTSDCSMYLILF